MIPKFAVLVCVSILLQIAVTNPVHHTHDEYDDQQDSQLWQKSGHFQGDILLTAKQAEGLFSGNKERNGIIDTLYRWHNKIIPYVISSDFTESQKDFIEKVIKKDFARVKNLRVIPRTNEVDYVLVTAKNTGCSSFVGRKAGIQELNLQPDGCLDSGTIVHEFMHAAGFFHQHSATERDDFVIIEWENIETGMEYAFEKYDSKMITNFGQRYDYGSVMHYGAYAFSKNGKKTIYPKENVKIGKAKKLSDIDIVKIDKMYDW